MAPPPPSQQQQQPKRVLSLESVDEFEKKQREIMQSRNADGRARRKSKENSRTNNSEEEEVRERWDRERKEDGSKMQDSPVKQPIVKGSRFMMLIHPLMSEVITIFVEFFNHEVSGINYLLLLKKAIAAVLQGL